MSTVVYLSNQEVRVVIGRQSGNTISVDAAIRENAPEGSIINGQVLNEEAFTEFLADFWERYRLPVKDVTLVLGSARTVVKAIAVPQLPYRKMMNYLPHEFACAKPENDAMYTYDVLFREGEKYRVFAGKMERGFLRQHILRFQKLGIRISSASIGMMMNIKMIQRIPHLQDKTCVVQMADGLNLVSILLVQGRYYHFTSSRVFASQGSMAFGWEIARAVGAMRLFLYAQNIAEPITHVYFADGFREEELGIYRESICQVDGSIRAEMIYGKQQELVRLACGLGEETADYYFTAIAGLLAEKNRQNLIYQYNHNPRRLRSCRKQVRQTLPAAVLVLVLSGMVCYQVSETVRNMEILDRQLEVMDHTERMERMVRYDSLCRENDGLTDMIHVISATHKNLLSYPIYTTKIREAVNRCAAGLGTAEIVRYDSESGKLQVDVRVRNAASVYRLVDRLKAEEDTFADIDYSGFDLEEGSGEWYASLVCSLAPPKEEEVLP